MSKTIVPPVVTPNFIKFTVKPQNNEYNPKDISSVDISNAKIHALSPLFKATDFYYYNAQFPLGIHFLRNIFSPYTDNRSLIDYNVDVDDEEIDLSNGSYSIPYTLMEKKCRDPKQLYNDISAALYEYFNNEPLQNKEKDAYINNKINYSGTEISITDNCGNIHTYNIPGENSDDYIHLTQDPINYNYSGDVSLNYTKSKSSNSLPAYKKIIINNPNDYRYSLGLNINKDNTVYQTISNNNNSKKVCIDENSIRTNEQMLKIIENQLPKSNIAQILDSAKKEVENARKGLENAKIKVENARKSLESADREVDNAKKQAKNTQNKVIKDKLNAALSNQRAKGAELSEANTQYQSAIILYKSAETQLNEVNIKAEQEQTQCKSINQPDDYADLFIKNLISMSFDVFPNYSSINVYESNGTEPPKPKHNPGPLIETLVYLIADYYLNLCENKKKAEIYQNLVNNQNNSGSEELYQDTVNKYYREYLRILNISFGIIITTGIIYQFSK
jgi:hypothetical protein